MFWNGKFRHFVEVTFALIFPTVSSSLLCLTRGRILCVIMHSLPQPFLPTKNRFALLLCKWVWEMKGPETRNIKSKEKNIVKNWVNIWKVLRAQFGIGLNPLVAASYSAVSRQVGLCLFTGWHDGWAGIRPMCLSKTWEFLGSQNTIPVKPWEQPAAVLLFVPSRKLIGPNHIPLLFSKKKKK